MPASIVGGCSFLSNALPYNTSHKASKKYRYSCDTALQCTASYIYWLVYSLSSYWYFTRTAGLSIYRSDHGFRFEYVLKNIESCP